MNGPLRLLLLAPGVLPEVSGNALTAERWRRGLAGLGHRVRVVATSGLDPARLTAIAAEFRPHLIHAHHGFTSGRLALAPEFARTPLVVSLSGTDLSRDLQDPECGLVVREVLRRAGRVVAQSDDLSRRVAVAVPDLGERLVRVPKAQEFIGDEPWDLRATCDVAAGEVLFLHPAGIRPVKGNLEALGLLAELNRRRPRVRAVFLGPALDVAYTRRFEAALGDVPFAHWLPGVEPSRMPGAYRAADVVLNTSVAEGLANVLLEAAASGVPVLASDIPANRGVLEGHGGAPAGLLFPSAVPEAFLRQALRLVDEPGLREELGQAGRARVRQLPSPAQEAEALVAVYRSVLGRDSTSGGL